MTAVDPIRARIDLELRRRLEPSPLLERGSPGPGRRP